MCGLAGFLAPGGADREAVETVRRMADTLAHRGPDDAGVWTDDDAGITLAHRRLAILDLSPAGHQPMQCPAGRYILVFNGEIYNHLDLRAELEKRGLAPQWRGHSDTETILAGFSAWGIRQTVERSVGMFAFAVWDRQLRQLTLARDRLGEKPLYYGWQGHGERACLLFGSELKALRTHPAFAGQIDRGAVALLMRHNYVPTPYSIYSGIRKLPPGTLLTLSGKHRDALPEPYWSLAEVAVSGQNAPFSGSPEEAVDMLESLLRQAIARQMLADVPLGAFLSGGVDSSTIVALMQVQSTRPIKTFTIGFDDAAYNEAEHAKAVARHLGTEHSTLYVSPAEAMAVIPKLPSLYCEPFSDSSQIPTFLVAQLARSRVTVSLSGDGGDELFGGYNRYLLANRLWRKLSRLPRGVRQGVAHGIRTLSPATWNACLAPVQRFLPAGLKLANIGDKMHKGSGVLAAESIDDLYRGLVSHWDPATLMLSANEPPTILHGNVPRLEGLDSIQRMMALDAVSYLPDDILVKVDRAAMGVSLETRVPMLDHRVVEFAWQLPFDLKIRHGQGKWPLRRVLDRYVPANLIERPKMGFGVPIDAWLRGPLRDWADSLLEPGRLRQEGFFEPAVVQRLWQEHLSGRLSWQYYLWDILMFQAWLEHNSQ